MENLHAWEIIKRYRAAFINERAWQVMTLTETWHSSHSLTQHNARQKTQCDLRGRELTVSAWAMRQKNFVDMEQLEEEHVCGYTYIY
jgi:hypothetical protein